MEFHPGDPLDDLGPDEWKDFLNSHGHISRRKIKNLFLMSSKDFGVSDIFYFTFLNL